MIHWAFDLIGRPHASVGRCWGLMRLAFKLRHGIVMPDVAIEKVDENVAAIKRAAEVSGWRRADAPAQADDIVLMMGPRGRHVGMMIDVDGEARLLHATEIDGVVHQSLREVERDGYSGFELWRRA